MTKISSRIATRFQLAGWLNAVNGETFTLRWNKSTWEVEEMADGSPFLSTHAYGDPLEVVRWQMPTCFVALKGKSEKILLDLDHGTIRSRAHVKASDTGADVRNKIQKAYMEVFVECQNSWAEEEPAKLEASKKIFAEVKKKLVWKKI